MKNQLFIRSYSTKPISHSHDYHQVVLPLRGAIDIQVGAFSGKVTLGQCVVVRASEIHSFKANTEARFVVADMRTLPDSILMSDGVVFEISKPLLSYLLFVESQLEIQINQSLEQSMYDMFYLLLGEHHTISKVDRRISSSLLFIENHLADPLSIGQLASIACLSPTQFKKNFKAQMGCTVFEYITQLRMEKAQALLTHTDYPLKIIGEKVGYSEMSTFSRKFSKYFGMPPTKFTK